MTRSWCQWGIVLAVVLVLISGGAGAISLGDSSVTPVSIVTAEDDPDDDYDDTRHENPDEADGDGDEDELARWLSDQLSESVGESSRLLSEGEYDAAREVLGDDYDDRLEQYVEVDGDTADDDDSDDEEDAGEAFRDTKENQEELINATEEYETTREKYEQALAEGDEERARELARQMEDAEKRVTETSENLDESYRVISEQTGADTSAQRESVNQTSSDISQSQSEVREVVFVGTELTVDTENETGTATEPIRITGELNAADESVLDDERILIEVDGRTTETTTENGTFTLDYRPVLLGVDADSVTVEFVPDPASPYLGAAADAQVDVTPTDPTLELESIGQSAGYGGEVPVSGSVHVDGTPVDQLLVRAQFSEQFQGDTVRTDADGSFTTTVTVPAEVPDGDVDVMATYDQSDRAVSPTNESTRLQVESTQTQIAVDAEADDDDVVSVTGSLRTEDGDPVSGQSIRLTSNGSPVGTVETNADGEFSDSAEFSQSAIPEDGMLGITVAYDGTGTNLEDSEESLLVATSFQEGGDSGSFTIDAWLVTGIIVIIVLVTAGGLYLGRRFGLSVPGLFDSTTGDSGSADPHVTSMDSGPTEHSNDRAAMKSIGEVSNDLLDAGRPNEAVITAYERTREQLSNRLDETRPRTYWEFYQDWRKGEDSDSEPLRVLTERYERATFTTDPIESEDAADAIDRAVELAEGDSA